MIGDADQREDVKINVVPQLIHLPISAIGNRKIQLGWSFLNVIVYVIPVMIVCSLFAIAREIKTENNRRHCLS
jgi:hypothetical protein